MFSNCPSASEQLCALVLAGGMQLGSVQRDAVVRWADSQIERRAEAPMWLIDLSLSQKLYDFELVNLLKVTAGVGNEAMMFVGACSLLPDLRDCGFDQCEAISHRVYSLARDCFDGDWSEQLLYLADAMSDEFALHRDGFSSLSREAVVEKFCEFIDDLRAEASAVDLSSIRLAMRDPPVPLP
jgi:hypothetical protein